MAGERAGKTAVITGGGRRFGKGFGEALAAEGAHVITGEVLRVTGGMAAGV